MKRHRNRFVFTLFLFLTSLTTIAYAQGGDPPPGLEPTLRFSHLTTDDGLAQNSISAILQDRRGFMWIGTQNGLSRFDGYRFITYQHDPDNPNSLHNNSVSSLIEDEQGHIWIVGRQGVTIFDPLTETFTPYQLNRNRPPGLANPGFFSIFQDSQGDFWFGGPPPASLFKLESTTQTIIPYFRRPDNPAGFQGGGVWQIAQDSAKNLWLATDNALTKFNLQTEQFSYFSPDPDERRLATLIIDSEGNFWLGGFLGLYRFNPQTEQFTHYPGPTQINRLLVDDTGSIWVSSLDGLFLFDPHTEQFIRAFYHNPADPNSLSSNRTTALYQDDGGVVWIGTTDDGLNLFNPRQTRFTHYQHLPNNPATLAEDQVLALAGDAAGRLWVATGSVLNQIDLAEGRIAHFQPVLDNEQPNIRAIQPDQAGYLWLGGSGRHLFRFDPITGQFTPYPLPARPSHLQPGPPMEVVALAVDHNDALWIAVIRDGLYKLDPYREKFQAYGPTRNPIAGPVPARPDPSEPLASEITALYLDHTGQLWLGYQQGLISRLDPQTGIFTHFPPQPGLGLIEAIHQDQAGLMWLATQTGLVSFDPATEKITRYTDKHGLPTSYVDGILEDQAGNLWLSTQKGLSKFDPQHVNFRNFDVSDGLQGNEFSGRAAWQASDGRMFFGGTHGLTAFYPDQIEDNPYQPPIVLTEVRLFNEPLTIGRDSLLPQALDYTEQLIFDYNQNIISFDFAALSYAAPHKNRYRHKLEGLENEWNEVGSDRRFATYTSLPPGNYIFRVQGSNNDGVWSEHEVALALTITPPWWETVWFRALGLVALVGLIYGGYHWRVQSIEQRNRQLEQQVAVRTEELAQAKEAAEEARYAAEAANRAKSTFLANMSHELRTPLNAIIGFTQIIARNASLPPEQQDHLGTINRSGEHLLSLINQVLDLSKIEAGRMVLDETVFDLHQLLTDLESMFRLRANQKRIGLVFERSPDVPRTIRTDEVKLRQVLINLLNNALKFTKEGSVSLKVSNKLPSVTGNTETLDTNISDTCKLLFVISDTGPGITPEEMDSLFEAFAQTETGRRAQEGTGLGLPISRRFVQLLGGDEIRVESPAQLSVGGKGGPGTIFAFEIQVEVINLAYMDSEQSTKELSSEIDGRVVGLAPDQPRYRLLIVDDEPVNRQLLRELLAPLGFDLREAENGQQAIDIWQEFQPHLIWMDMRMPVLDGYEATKIIKSKLETRDSEHKTVIIAITASSFEEDKADILAAGCDDFLRKPFRENTLFQMMSQHLGVQFIYETPDDVSATGEMGEYSLLPEMMAALPLDDLTSLAEAIELSDVVWANEIINKIRPSQPELALRLSRLVNNFEYGVILDAIKQAMTIE